MKIGGDDPLRRKVEEDPDFIAAPKYGDSLKTCIADREPPELDLKEQVPRTIARMLRMTQEEATQRRDTALAELREELEES